MIIQFFFKFHNFSMHGTLFSDFPGFPWFPELVGTLRARLILTYDGTELYSLSLTAYWSLYVVMFMKFYLIKIGLHPAIPDAGTTKGQTDTHSISPFLLDEVFLLKILYYFRYFCVSSSI